MMRNHLNYLYILSLWLLCAACDSRSNLEKEIDAVPVDVQIVRFDRIFADTKPEGLAKLKKEFPFFFPGQYSDSVWLNQLQDSLQIQLNEAVGEVFSESNLFGEDLVHLFQHIKYYFPEVKVPKVYTVTSDWDYRTRAVANDSLLILALDTFLGREHVLYEGIPKYISQNLDPEQLIPEVAAVYGRKFVSPPEDRTLLAQMIYHGKLLYLSDLWLPDYTDAQKIGYSESDLEWARSNEEDIWKYFVEMEYLYATDAKLHQRFIDPAPFSKFNLEIDNDSPGRIGRWVGWQIVRSYAQENETPLSQLLRMPTGAIFNNSKYKPRR